LVVSRPKTITVIWGKKVFNLILGPTAAGSAAVSITAIFLLVVYGVLLLKSLTGSLNGTKLKKILIAVGFAVLVLGLFITGFIKKDIRVLLNIFTFLSAGCLAAAFFMEALKGD
jgi:hypothetical protein